MSEELIGKLQGSRVKFGPEAMIELHDQSHFGRPSGKGLDLSLIEAAYLLDRSKIKINSIDGKLDFRDFILLSSALEKGFEFKYLVYKDLRERGYCVKPGRPDFRIYPRGGHPGKTPAEFYVLAISERMPLPLREAVEAAKLAGRMRKKLMIAIVDEESDITFYEAKEKVLSGRMSQEEQAGTATLLEDRVVLWDIEASKKLHQRGFFGKPVGERLQLSLVESAYLLNKGLIKLVDRTGHAVDLNGLKERARQIEDEFDTKYVVYKDLRDRKMVAKTGFKFGTHFRVYKNVENVEKVPHSEYLVHTVSIDYVFVLPVLSRAIRLAHSVRKKMIFAYQDKTVQYLEIERLRP